MNALERRVLSYLRVYGPCSCRTLARKMGGEPNRREPASDFRVRVFAALVRLRNRGLAEARGYAEYDTTMAGDVAFMRLVRSRGESFAGGES
jgi:hypothetical protein